MAMSGTVMGKVLYGAFFVAVLPFGLVAWAVTADSVVPLPVPPYSYFGTALAVVGIVGVLAGMIALVRFGRGLPMNAYPPPEFVRRGVYKYISHPIYVGFFVCCVGVSLWLQSPAGLWLVCPMLGIAMAALVLGYERHDLRRRFGKEVTKPLLALPIESAQRPTMWNRISIFVMVLIPWGVAFEAVYRLGVPKDALVAYLPFERGWPVLEWTEAIYGSVYFLVLSALLAASTQAALRRMGVMGLVATAVVTFVYITVPLVAPPRPFVAQTFLGRMLDVERAMSHTVAAFPAFHVIWSFIAADAWASRGRMWGRGARIWAAIITVSCVTTGMHALADILAALVVYALLLRRHSIWRFLRSVAERVGNSWREWRWGAMRLINHGFYAALAASVGFWIALSATRGGGDDLLVELLVIHLCGLLGAGLWAQRLEGSPELSRPFGYYGSLVAGIVAAVVVGTLRGHTQLLLGAIALEAPWLQGIGRLRCLVQGCCHGREAPEGVGIRYWRSRSRVCQLAHRRGVPLHPTPLYSLLGNVVIGVLLLRLSALGVAPMVLAGVYLMLAGSARFVEESYRGEPQTPRVGGLPIYQWLAVVSFGAGAALTTVPSGHMPIFDPVTDVAGVSAALVLGLMSGAAMGVDFPAAHRRFARLAAP